MEEGLAGCGAKACTAEARLVELAVVRTFAALWGNVDHQERASLGPRTDGWGG